MKEVGDKWINHRCDEKAFECMEKKGDNIVKKDGCPNEGRKEQVCWTQGDKWPPSGWTKNTIVKNVRYLQSNQIGDKTALAELVCD